jgi:DNA (cytosine-5)-methyltransferase 1
MSFSKTFNNRPIAVDLFAGAGGLSLGFEQAGFHIAAAIEIDPVHCATHEYNFPYSTVLSSSVAVLSGNEIRVRACIGDMDIDVLCGGPPCQGFSLIGKRALDDPRNQLVFHYVRLVDELRPKYFVFENVKGLTVGPHKKFLAELMAAFRDLGYRLHEEFQVLNAVNHGVPQDRRRLFLIGSRGDVPMAAYPKSKSNRATVRDAIADLPNADEFDELLERDGVAVRFITEYGYARRLRGLDEDAEDFSYPRLFDRDFMTGALRTKHTDLSQRRFSSTKNGTTEPVSRFLKLDPDGVCNTLRAGTDSARGAFTSPRPIHPVFPRVITVREAARLHSYPDWFRFHATKWHGFRQIGNSVPPLLARAVAAEVVDAMGYKPNKPLRVLKMGDERLLSLDMSEAAMHFGVSRTVIAQRIRKNTASSNGERTSYERELFEEEAVAE